MSDVHKIPSFSSEIITSGCSVSSSKIHAGFSKMSCSSLLLYPVRSYYSLNHLLLSDGLYYHLGYIVLLLISYSTPVFVIYGFLWSWM